MWIGHLSPPPQASGVTPASLSFCTAPVKSVQVWIAVPSTPAFWNRSLLYQNDTTPLLNGAAQTLLSNTMALIAPWLSWPRHSPPLASRAASIGRILPVSDCSFSTPPPQV